MNYYETQFKKLIEPFYGSKRSKMIDEELLKGNLLPHTYSVIERIDMTNYQVYSIDPQGCEDADDAFSIYFENQKLYLAIHIADPTEYINLDSELWKTIEVRVVTRYPSNRKPIHMMPEEIMSKSSLMVNEFGNTKNAITVLTEIDQITYHPKGKVRLVFSRINVKIENALSYTTAGEIYDTCSVLQKGIKISNALLEARSYKTKGTILNEICNSYVKYENECELTLYRDTVIEKEMKTMIAEFAIFANTFVGEYLKINFHGRGLFRTCNANEWLQTVYNISGQELLNEIIVNGIRADYMSNVSSHDLVGSPEYCHFTSPIRRLSDCVCHYLLKYIQLKQSNTTISVPFTNEQLEKYSTSCVSLTKSMKNIQYKDNKFRLIQVMGSLLICEEPVKIGYYVSSYTGLFLNIIINSINEHTIYISYTLRINNLESNKYQIKKQNFLDITTINCLDKFDQGSIPELDACFVN